MCLSQVEVIIEEILKMESAVLQKTKRSNLTLVSEDPKQTVNIAILVNVLTHFHKCEFDILFIAGGVVCIIKTPSQICIRGIRAFFFIGE